MANEATLAPLGERDAAALERLGALGHETRLAAVRLLVARAPEALPAGRIAVALGVRENALSPHLDRLVRAGLIARRRAGREILYAADLEGVSGLLAFLLEDCCGGRPELCGPWPGDEEKRG
ncbi:MAG: metalloregulator ArsR/SmtB family transcription factor [Alphaproteobacteria bacterium]|nr:metalloregulator ArsR/SmtB family transcription factor [Alphaproteobacteria bacterium]